jgi:hypothetical protein
VLIFYEYDASAEAVARRDLDDRVTRAQPSSSAPGRQNARICTAGHEFSDISVGIHNGGSVCLTEVKSRSRSVKSMRRAGGPLPGTGPAGSEPTQAGRAGADERPAAGGSRARRIGTGLHQLRAAFADGRDAQVELAGNRPGVGFRVSVAPGIHQTGILPAVRTRGSSSRRHARPAQPPLPSRKAGEAGVGFRGRDPPGRWREPVK